MSQSLQSGIWLIRCLRPPARTLAFSRPALAGQAAWEFPNSNARDISATRSSLLYTGQIGDNPRRILSRHAHCHPILGGVFQPLSPVRIHDACTGFLRLRRSQDWSVNHLWLVVAELLSAGFRHPRLPIADACCVVLVPLSKHNSFKEQSLAPLEGAQGLMRRG